MKLEEIAQTYESYTKGASEGARSLSFAGIAVVWLFKVEQNGAIHLDQALIYAGMFFVVALALDMLHYIVGTIVFQIFGNIRHKLHGAARDAENPNYVNWPMDALFWSKLTAVLAGYVLLLAAIYGKLA